MTQRHPKDFSLNSLSQLILAKIATESSHSDNISLDKHATLHNSTYRYCIHDDEKPFALFPHVWLKVPPA